jgi:hypothetical protein
MNSCVPLPGVALAVLFGLVLAGLMPTAWTG